MNTLFFYLLLSLLFTLLFFAIGFALRRVGHLRAHAIHFHHAYFGLIIFSGVGITHYLLNYTYFFISLGIGLILSDVLHHLFFRLPFYLNK